MRTLLTSLLVAAAFSAPLTAQTLRDDGDVQRDRDLFREVLKHVSSSTALPIRVDPRVLRADPALVTLVDMDNVLADEVGMGQHLDPLAKNVIALVSARGLELTKSGIERTDALRDLRCPGAMIPPSPAVDAKRKEFCPTTPFVSVIMSQPREGGPWWPGHVDERTAFAGRAVFSVRVISRHMALEGSFESSADYVFERARSGAWTLLVVKPLLVVE